VLGPTTISRTRRPTHAPFDPLLLLFSADGTCTITMDVAHLSLAIPATGVAAVQAWSTQGPQWRQDLLRVEMVCYGAKPNVSMHAGDCA
jgi:hypothetical protein